MRVCLRFVFVCACPSCCECILGCVYWSKPHCLGQEQQERGSPQGRRMGGELIKQEMVREVTLGEVMEAGSRGCFDLAGNVEA